jgi:hypothetical protein
MNMKANPVFWLMWLLPGAAVCASFATLAIALDGADVKLPPTYHWEGQALDEDFERARRAVALGIRGSFQVDAAAGECVLTLTGPASDSLQLLLTHSNDVDLDRRVLLRRAAGGEFRAPCEKLPPARWRIALDDEVKGWSLRARTSTLERVELQARNPGGGT